MKDGPKKFRELLAKGGLIVAPGVYDGYSARLVEKAGFEMAATTGAGISNSLLGIDDIGVMGLSENVDHCRMLARTLSIPLTADADTGYGNPMNVHYTVQMFEEAGLAGINIEDQVHPKRCGHMPGGSDTAGRGREKDGSCLPGSPGRCFCHHRAHGRAGD
jgi:2-methylisocitrate lyase-like PEP mutase family enzyme